MWGDLLLVHLRWRVLLVAGCSACGGGDGKLRGIAASGSVEKMR